MKTSSISSFQNLAKILRHEQARLIAQAAEYGILPGKALRREIAELELNIAAVENNLSEIELPRRC